MAGKPEEAILNADLKKQMSLGVILSYVSIVVKLATGILYTPIVLHALGQSQYGVYSLCISFIGYLTIFNAGVNAAYIRFYVQEKTVHKENIEKLNGLFCKIFVVLSAIGFIGGVLMARFSPVIFGDKITSSEYELVRRCFLLLAFIIAIEIFSCLFKSFLTANEEFIFGKSIDVISAILAPILTLPLLLNGANCTSIIGIRLALAIIILTLDIIFCRRKLSIEFHFSKVEKGLFKDITHFMGFIFLQSIMDQLNWQIDKLILARMQGTSEISIYSVGTTFNNLYMTISAAVASVFIAEANRMVALNENQKLNNLFIKTSRICAYVTFIIMIEYSCLGRCFIKRWAGPEYSTSYTIGFLLMFPLTFSLCLGLGQDITRAKNKHGMQIILDFLICIVNVIVSIPLALKWGAIGSAIGTFVSEIILCCIIQPIYYHKVVGLNVLKTYKSLFRILLGGIIPILYGITINNLGLIYENYASIGVHGIIMFVVYCISIYIISFDTYEKELFNKLFERICNVGK